MLEHVRQNFTKDLLDFSKLESDIPSLQDKFEYCHQEYLNTLDTGMRAFLASCYILYRTYFAIKTKGISFEQFYRDECARVNKALENENNESEATALIKNTTHLKVQTARIRMKIGAYVIEPFLQREREKMRQNPEYIPNNIVSYGMTQSDFVMLLREPEVTRLEKLDELLVNGDAFGRRTIAEKEAKPKKEWYEKPHIIKQACERVEYLVQHGFVEVYEGLNKIELPKTIKIKLKENNNE